METHLVYSIMVSCFVGLCAALRFALYLVQTIRSHSCKLRTNLQLTNQDVSQSHLDCGKVC